jgi:hypothetical protein
MVSTIRQNLTPPYLLGRASAASRTVVAVFSLTARILAGAIANAYGAKGVMLGLGLATAVGSVGLMLTPLKDSRSTDTLRARSFKLNNVLRYSQEVPTC